MLEKTITYEDYKGTERTETFLFNISKSELIKLNLGVDGGLQAMLEKIIAAKNIPQIMEMFEKIIKISYGEITPDGRRLVKSEELSTAFMQTEAYDQLFMELISDAEKAAKFINAVIPKDLAEEASAEMKKNPALSVLSNA